MNFLKAYPPKTFQRRALKTGGIAAIVFLVCSCGDILTGNEYEFDGIEASPTMALPLAYGDLSIQDILNKKDSSFIKVDADGLVYLEYSQALRSQAIKELVNIPDKENVSKNLIVPLGGMVGPIPADMTLTQVNDTVFFDVTPEELDEILLKSGEIAYNVNITPPNANIRYVVNITIAEFESPGGTSLSQDISGSGSIPLDGYLYKSSVPNRMVIQYSLIIKENPNTFFVDPASEVNVDLSFRGLDYSYAKGYFNQQEADVPPDTIKIEAFGHSLANEDNIHFEGPEVKFTAINDAGVPIRLNFTSLGALKPGGTIPIQINPANPTIEAAAALGDEKSTVINVDNENEFVDLKPTKMFYKVTAYINDPVPLANNFIADTSALKVNMSVRMPLYGYVKRIELHDTLAIGLGDIDESTIESGALKLKAVNEIPLEANIQFYLADDNYQILDSLITPSQPMLIKSSQVNAAGDLQSPGSADVLVPIATEKLNKMFEASHILIKASMNTSQQPDGSYLPVKFRAGYKIDIKLGLQAKLKIKVKI